ncbi:MAG: hypothetical protein ACRCZF_22725, partial [Gemmataceae bacterium]
DLSMALGLNPEAWPERYEIWRTNEPSPGQLPADDLLKIPERLTHLTPSRSISGSATGPRLLVLHDSFGPALVPFLAQDSPALVSFGSYHLPKTFLDARTDHPEHVIQIVVERMLRISDP